MNKLIYNIKKYVPSRFRRFILSRFDFSSYREYSNVMSNPYRDDADRKEYSNSQILAGIVYSNSNYHKFWIAACRDLQISYQIIYLEKHDWIEQIASADCDVLLVWPDITSQYCKTLQDERLKIACEELNKPIYPTLNEIWLYENKRAQHYWLRANNFKTPETRVFYRLDEALRFLKSADYPLVFKSNFGASASGVYIIKDKYEAIKKAKNFLRKGYKVKGEKGIPRQVGSLYVQEFLPAVKEWRMVRIGESYFGHGKDMVGQFHSGSGKANWDLPPIEAFNLLFELTEKGRFTSMDVDIFQTEAGELYVNELQTVFGNSIAKEQLKVNNIPGRMVRTEDGNFVFEKGSFCENHLCNLRLQHYLHSRRDSF